MNPLIYPEISLDMFLMLRTRRERRDVLLLPKVHRCKGRTLFIVYVFPPKIS